jgi:hypothetical protein
MMMAAAAAGSTSAWITVAGVVGGAAVSGIVAVVLALVQRRSLDDQAARQQAMQREQAAGQSSQQLRVWQLDLRRNTYADYLMGIEALRGLIVPLDELFSGSWPRRDGVPAAELGRLDVLLTMLRDRRGEAVRHGQLVRLAGPPDIDEDAGRTLVAMSELYHAAESRHRAAVQNVKPADGEQWSRAVADMNAAVESFIAHASAILGDRPLTGE